MTPDPATDELENRTPREKFTKALSRICKRLDEQASFGIEDRRALIRMLVSTDGLEPEDAREQVEITKLWVVGSYARGVLRCGDLDVLIQTRRCDGQPRRVHYTRLLKPAFGHVPHLRVYEGTPEENSSGIVFADAIQIWSPGADWKEAIAGIKPDPAAQRFRRDTDVVPMRAEQLYGGVETMDELAKHDRTGDISWRFVALGAAPELGELSKIERGLLERYRWGRKTLELIPYVLQYLRQHRLTQFEHVSHHDGATLDIQGVHVAMGLPYPAYGRLDSLNCSRVLAIPHTSARGPNGILELRRGPNHPLERAFAGVAAYVHQYPGCKLAVIGVCGQHWNDRAYTLQLFATEHCAQEDLEEWADCDEGNASAEEVAPHVARLAGSALLDAIAHADILEIVDGAEDCIARYHLTHTGARIDEVDYAFPYKGPDASIIVAALRTAQV